MNAVAAVSKNYGIGLQNNLLFHIPEDMKFFRSLTLGKTVVMGKNTFFSMPGKKALPKRRNIVLSGSMEDEYEDIEICRSAGELFSLIRDENPDDVFIIGGENIYKQFVPLCSRVYITWVDEYTQADRFFPPIDKDESFKLIYKSQTKEHEGISFTFCTYEKLRNI